MQSLHRAQDRDRRRDHPVGVEERSAEQSEKQKKFAAPAHDDVADQVARARMPPSPRLSARRIRMRYLTEMIRMSDQRMSERTPRDVGRRGSERVLAVEAFAQGIERARADIAVNDSEAGEAEQKKAALRRRRITGGRIMGRRVRSGRRQGWKSRIHRLSELNMSACPE